MKAIQEKIRVVPLALLHLGVLTLPIWLLWLLTIVIDWVVGNG